MQSDKRLRVAAFAIGLVFMAGTARAQYSGIGIQVTDTQARTATLANFNTLNTGSAPEVTFSASALDFNSFGALGCTAPGVPSAACLTAGTDYTFASFLNSLGSASGLAFSNGLTGGTALGGSGEGALFEFNGTASFTHGQSFTLSHDDGVDLWVNGVNVFTDPGPTSPSTDTFSYTGVTGNFNFHFVYGECCTAPAVFETTLVPSVPEPNTVLPLGAMLLLGVGLAFRRKARLSR